MSDSQPNRLYHGKSEVVSQLFPPSTDRHVGLTGSSGLNGSVPSRNSLSGISGTLDAADNLLLDKEEINDEEEEEECERKDGGVGFACAGLR